MLARNLKLFTNNNLFCRNLKHLKNTAIESTSSLSSSSTIFNKYEELYKERFATFQCKNKFIIINLIESGHP